MAGKKRIVIRATELFDGKSSKGKKTVVIEGNKIVDVLSKNLKSDYEGIVTPAFIDPHSHIGMMRAGEPDAEQEGNDHISQISPNHDPINGVYFDDQNFVDSVDFGVLYSCIIPGSGNLFGGRAKVIRNFAKHRGEALYSDLGYKMALGYNPRSTKGWRGERPSTRMGVYGMLERHFDEVLRKKERSDYELERKKEEIKNNKNLNRRDQRLALERAEKESHTHFSADDLATLDALSGKRTVKVHVHKEDDLLYLLELKKKYGMKITAEHLGDVFHEKIFKECKKAGVSVVYGPLGSFNYKTELKHAYYQNAGLLRKSGAHYGLMTDHPIVHSTALRDSLKFFLIAGAEKEEALSIITKRNAEVIEVDDKLGTIEVGKLASILVWDKDPLYLGAIPKVVIAEGKVLRK